MVKKLYTIAALVLIGTVIHAQINLKDPVQSDPEAKRILDAVSNKFKSFKSVLANFIYRVENSSGKALSNKAGKVYMKGTKYRVSFGGQDIFCDGVNVYSYDKSAKEVTVTKLDASGSTITPQKLFTNFYDKDFLYKLNGEKKVKGKTFQEIEMTPNDKNKPFHKVYVLVDKAGKTIYSTSVMEKTGNKCVYTVSSMKPNAAVADSQFVFDKSKYPGVEVIDLR